MPDMSSKSPKLPKLTKIVKSPKYVRPYWHVDAKWVSGILFVIFFGFTLLLYSFTWLTSERRAVNIIATSTAAAFSRKGIDDATEINIFKQRIAIAPNKQIKPIPGLNIVLTAKDLEGKSAREIRVGFFKKVAEPLYMGGADGLAGLATNAQMKKQIQEGVGLFGAFSSKTHKILLTITVVFAVVSAGLLALLVFFSFGLGRLLSPGLVLFIIAAPGAIFFKLLSFGLHTSLTKAPVPELAKNISDQVTYIVANAMAEPLTGIYKIYLAVFIISLALIALSALAKFARRFTS